VRFRGHQNYALIIPAALSTGHGTFRPFAVLPSRPIRTMAHSTGPICSCFSSLICLKTDQLDAAARYLTAMCEDIITTPRRAPHISVGSGFALALIAALSS
jgi:hypothetical protein